MTNIDESTTNDPDKEEQNLEQTPSPADYFHDLEQNETVPVYPVKIYQKQKVDSLEIRRK